MKFWKVFFSGKKDELTEKDCAGSYTVTATCSSEAEQAGASAAHYDGVSHVMIHQCEPLIKENLNELEYEPYGTASSYTALTNNDKLEPGYNTYVSSSSNHGYVAYAYGNDSDKCNSNCISEESCESDESSLDYVPFVAQDKEQEQDAEMVDDYKPYNEFKNSNSNIDSRVYQEPLSNGYYRYKLFNRIRLTKDQSFDLRKLVKST